ncbi:hypothetical protein [Halegenticoccus tardaugens]|uniref:hypothetical protein n=1 Tax=Halegenticoccus tardaugens TaxID=2071624 RepID=UPI00100B0C57|nr:hypothetical protein [Halegenticoccus tardaugens]
MSGDDSGAEGTMEEITDAVEGVVDAVGGTGDGTGDESEGVAGDESGTELEELREVLEELEELLETVDLDSLPDAINLGELPSVIDADGVSKAIEEADPDEAVSLENVPALVELSELLDSVDVREFWRNKRELDDAVGDVTGDDGDDGDLLPGVDGDDVDAGEMVDIDAEEMVDVDLSGADDGSTDGDGLGSPENLEAYQATVQMGINEAVEEFREGLIVAHRKLDALREENEKRTSSVGQPNSRNPTAFSTLPSRRTAVRGAAQFSTVPKETRYSSAPNHERIYGDRFLKERGDDDE